MTSYEFEKVAKNAVIKIMKDKRGVDLKIEDLDFVWFAHELGFKKCTLYAKDMGNYYAEVTYNKGTEELYVDIYLKEINMCISKDDFNFNA